MTGPRDTTARPAAQPAPEPTARPTPQRSAGPRRSTPGRRSSLRIRLTLTFAGVFVVLGGALIALTASLAQTSLTRAYSSAAPAAAELKQQIGEILSQPDPDSSKPPLDGRSSASSSEPRSGQPAKTEPPGEEARRKLIAASNAYSQATRDTAVHRLIAQSVIAAAVLIPLAVLLAWWLAGRSLRPVRTITDAARLVSANQLSERLALTGPKDEITQLADTFDAMMDRLEHAFDAQRRFIANASHELRTPLAVAGTAVDVVLAKPDRRPAQLEAMARDVRAAIHRAELLVDSLLTLTRSQHLDHARDPIDLAAIVEDVLDDHRRAIAERALTVSTQLPDAPAVGDRVLLERLVTNLVENAIQHNIDGGHIDLRTARTPDGVALEVANSGAVIPPDQLLRLVEPFHRLYGRARSSEAGLGLGLAIAAAVAEAHGAALSFAAQPSGGLTVALHLPVPAESGWAVSSQTALPTHRMSSG